MLEREIKFRLPPGEDPALIVEAIQSAGFRLEPSRGVSHEDRYLDTEDWALYRAGLALRLRREGSEGSLEAKTIRSRSEETLERTEWVEPAPPGDPPWMELPEGPVAALLAPLGRLRVIERLQVRARVHSDRRLFRWLSDQEVLGSVSFDHVRNSGTSRGDADYREVEIELLDGATDALADVRAAVEHRIGLRSTTQSKLAAALAIAGERLPELDERPYALHEGDRLADVAVKTLGRHFTRMFWSEPGTRLNVDPEHLHDMRVATRRLRTALQVFSMAIPEAVQEDFSRELRWIGRALGRVRDIDVGLDRVQRMSLKAPEHERAALYVFARYLEIRRARRRRRLLRRLDSHRYEAFRDRARSWMEGMPSVWEAVATPERQVDVPGSGGISPSFAPAYMIGPRIVAEWDRRLREACEEAERRPSAANVHALRIAVKHARYAVEYFAVGEGRNAHRRAKQLARLQDTLGDHQDAATLLDHMRRYARTVPKRDRQLTLGARAVMDRLEEDSQIAKSELREVWELGTGADVTAA